MLDFPRDKIPGLSYEHATSESKRISVLGLLKPLTAFLNSIEYIYIPRIGFLGNDLIEVWVSVRGNTGVGGSLSTSLSISVQVAVLKDVVVMEIQSDYF